MTDAQYIFDLARKQYNELAEGLEQHFESVATQLKDWIPQTRPPPPPPPRRILPVTYWQNVQRWISQNTATAAGVAAFVGTGAVLLFIQRRAHMKKRRAKRSSSGARTEVVVIAGAPHSPMTTALALDLERRGFIVYVITNSAEEEQHVRNMSRVDLMPLAVDLSYPAMAQEQVARFNQFLNRHHHAYDGAPAHRLTLAGVVLAPDTSVPSGPISAISPEAWSVALNAKVLATIATTQLLLPTVMDLGGKVLLLTPSVVSSLRPPYHAVESTVTSALEAFVASLGAELRLRNMHVCHFKLGHIETPGSKRKDEVRRIKGTSMRKLHESVFDALQAKRPARTWHVGRGSLVYDLIGGYIPSGVTSWMMGIKSAATQDDVSHESDDDFGERSIQWEKIDD